ncbi:MAG TPA: hypothetical protein VGD98_01840 [Ktedonobacteraceae bacterium]
MSKRTRILILVNERAEGFYERSTALGTLAAQTFLEEIHYRGSGALSDKDAKMFQSHRAQLTGLENIAETTLKVADVLDYIKKQIARPDRRGWREVHEGQRFGESLKNMIERDLRTDVEYICAKIHIGNDQEEDMRDRQYIYLQLIRQLVRQVVVQYEYSVSERVSQRERESWHDQRTGTGAHPTYQR